MELLLASVALLILLVLALSGFVALLYLAVAAFQRVLIWFDTEPRDT